MYGNVQSNQQLYEKNYNIHLSVQQRPPYGEPIALPADSPRTVEVVATEEPPPMVMSSATEDPPPEVKSSATGMQPATGKIKAANR